MPDVSHVEHGFIKRDKLYTIRVGELVCDNVNNELIVTEKEIIKIHEKNGTDGCIYYNQSKKACLIYDHRPIQCSALACWDDQKFMNAFKGPKPGRKEIIHDKIILGLIDRHEEKCNYHEIEKHVKQIETAGDKAVKTIIDILKFDYHIRPFVSKKMNINPAEMDLIFGRPLMETIKMFGLRVTQEPDGSFFLTVV